MLTPKQLLAETAKFFKLHPDRFLTGTLSNRNNPVEADDNACFCTVGYMAYRLAKEDPSLRPTVRRDPYKTVAQFFGGKYGSDAQTLYRMNDGPSSNAGTVADRLVEEAARA